MTVAELLAATRAAGIRLRVERGRLFYDAPAGALTTDLRQALSARKSELLAHLSADGAVPLAFPQQSLWFLHQLHPQDTSASEQFAIRIDGPFDAALLAQAWQALLARHAILRTTFSERDGEVWQRAALPVPDAVPLPQVHVGTAPEDLLQIAAAALREPFDLLRGPLLEPQLCRITDEQHVLLVTAHHIIADGLSVPVIRGEIAALYAALRNGKPSPLPAVQFEYADFALAQTRIDAQREAGILQRWQEILASPPPPALQALVRPPPGPKISRRATFSLDAVLADGLRRLARDCGTTPYVVLLAAFRLLLVRLTGQHDLVIGTPTTLRDSPELRNLIGCLVNPLALRVPLELQDSFRSHLRRERSMVLEALQYRELPFSRVVAAIGPERKLDEHPLFQILFSWETETPVECDQLPRRCSRDPSGRSLGRAPAHSGRLEVKDHGFHLALQPIQLMAVYGYEPPILVFRSARNSEGRRAGFPQSSGAGRRQTLEGVPDKRQLDRRWRLSRPSMSTSRHRCKPRSREGPWPGGGLPQSKSCARPPGRQELPRWIPTAPSPAGSKPPPLAGGRIPGARIESPPSGRPPTPGRMPAAVNSPSVRGRRGRAGRR